MYSITIFQELLQGLPRGVFAKAVRERNADKYVKKFFHWDHLVAMLYAQLSSASDLRALEIGFNNHASHHYHLGTDQVKRTTLAKANETRCDAVFSDVATWLMGRVSSSVRAESKELMYLLDSTSITLKGREFDAWTLENRNRNTQGIKMHVLIDAMTQAPDWHSFSAANVNDVELVGDIPLRSGALYVFDKGYCDYNWWHRIDQAGSRFVTRFKRNAAVEVLEERKVAVEHSDIVLSDQIVTFKNKSSAGKKNAYYGHKLRRIVIARPDKPSPMVIATNDMLSTAEEIAQRYKERWGIEMFFKWVKQHLKIKKFLGRSENAVRIQLLTALISYLLIALHKQRHAIKATLWECLTLVRATLFQRRRTEQAEHRRRTQERHDQMQIQPSLF